MIRKFLNNYVGLTGEPLFLLSKFTCGSHHTLFYVGTCGSHHTLFYVGLKPSTVFPIQHVVHTTRYFMSD